MTVNIEIIDTTGNSSPESQPLTQILVLWKSINAGWVKFDTGAGSWEECVNPKTNLCYKSLVYSDLEQSFIDISVFNCASGEDCISNTCLQQNLSVSVQGIPITVYSSTPPGQPRDLSVTAKDESLIISWSSPALTIPSIGVFAYYITIKDPNGNIIDSGYTSSLQREIQIDNLTNGVAYNISVRSTSHSNVESTELTATGIPGTTGNITFISIPPGADIYLDGILKTEKTDNTISDVAVGCHYYTLKLNGFYDASGTVTVIAEQTAIVSVTLIPITTVSGIYFESSPPGADIYINGVKWIEKTPTTISGVSPGDYIYTLKLAGYYDASDTVTVIENEITTVSVTLIPTGAVTSVAISNNSIGIIAFGITATVLFTIEYMILQSTDKGR